MKKVLILSGVGINAAPKIEADIEHFLSLK